MTDLKRIYSSATKETIKVSIVSNIAHSYELVKH